MTTALPRVILCGDTSYEPGSYAISAAGWLVAYSQGWSSELVGRPVSHVKVLIQDDAGEWFVAESVAPHGHLRPLTLADLDHVRIMLGVRVAGLTVAEWVALDELVRQRYALEQIAGAGWQDVVAWVLSSPTSPTRLRSSRCSTSTANPSST